MIEYLKKVAAGRWRTLTKFQKYELKAQGLVYLDEYDSPKFTDAGKALLSDRPHH